MTPLEFLAVSGGLAWAYLSIKTFDLLERRGRLAYLALVDPTRLERELSRRLVRTDPRNATALNGSQLLRSEPHRYHTH